MSCKCIEVQKKKKMSSIVYSFHWVQRSIDEKKQRELESNESIPTTNSIQLKNTSFLWLNQLFKSQPDYPYSNNFDFQFLHSIL
jgi:hypothetical protein